MTEGPSNEMFPVVPDTPEGAASADEHGLVRFMMVVEHNKEALRQGDAEVVRRLCDEIKEKEQEMPMPEWDDLRLGFCICLIVFEHDAMASSIAEEISSAHKAIEIQAYFAENRNQTLHNVHAYVLSITDETRQIALTRALRDYAIEYEPGNPGFIEELNDYLARSGVESDPVQGWADSENAEDPDTTWPAIVAYVRDDTLWGNIPTIARQSIMKQNLVFKDVLYPQNEGYDPAVLAEIVAWITQNKRTVPDALFWDDATSEIALSLLLRGAAVGLELGAMIDDPKYQTKLGQTLIAKGHEQIALDFVVKMRDYRNAITFLLDAPWSEEYLGKSSDVIAQVIEGDEFPLLQRIAFAEILRDRAILRGQPGLRVRAQQYLDNLEQQKDH